MFWKKNDKFDILWELFSKFLLFLPQKHRFDSKYLEVLRLLLTSQAPTAKINSQQILDKAPTAKINSRKMFKKIKHEN